MVPEQRLQKLIASKDIKESAKLTQQHQYVEGWAIIDGCLVIYDANDSPKWLTNALMERDEDGNTPSFYDKSLRENLEQREAA